MLKRTFDPDFLNAVANDAAVRPWLLGDGVIDLGPLLADERNVALVNDAGGFVLTANGLGDYEVHTMFMPGADDVAGAARECAAWVFSNTDAMRIVTKCPRDNLRARKLAEATGLRVVFEMPAWACLALDIDAWAMSLADDPADAAWAAVEMIAAHNPVKARAWLARWTALAGSMPVPVLSEAA
jgi:hypothetical protein